MPRGRPRKTPLPKADLSPPKRRGRPRKQFTGEELLRRHPRGLIWCDENGNPAPDKSGRYIRALTKAELEAAAIAEINETLGSNPDFERCACDGTPDPNGTHWKWKLREPVNEFS